MIVCKFGGSSLADARQIEKVKNIIEDSSLRKLLVVSAPGRRNPADRKVTDLLYSCARSAAAGRSIEPEFALIRDRYEGICSGLHMECPVSADLDEIAHRIAAGFGADYAADYAASRGEYLSAKVLSVYFDAEFIDAAEVIRLTEDGLVDPLSYSLVKERTAGDRRYIVPGFYGTGPSGAIKTFSRGGSDITGAVVSRAVGAELYENWTDVPGVMMADPRIFDNPPVVQEITYREIRELAGMGTEVFHEEAIAPVKDVQIPINIRNTNDPSRTGTLITASRSAADMPVAGLAGKKGYTAVRFETFHHDITEILHDMDVKADFILYGNESAVCMVQEGNLQEVSRFREKLLSIPGLPDSVEVEPDIGIIGIVGEGLSAAYNNAAALMARIFTALNKNHVTLRYTSFGGSDSTILLGVEEADFSKALESVYGVLEK